MSATMCWRSSWWSLSLECSQRWKSLNEENVKLMSSFWRFAKFWGARQALLPWASSVVWPICKDVGGCSSRLLKNLHRAQCENRSWSDSKENLRKLYSLNVWRISSSILRWFKRWLVIRNRMKLCRQEESIDVGSKVSLVAEGDEWTWSRWKLEFEVHWLRRWIFLSGDHKRILREIDCLERSRQKIKVVLDSNN